MWSVVDHIFTSSATYTLIETDFIMCLHLLNHWFNFIEIVGQIDTFLSEKGIEQAQLVGTKLQDEQFSHIFSSDLSRARNVSFISYKLWGCTAKQLEKKN